MQVLHPVALVEAVQGVEGDPARGEVDAHDRVVAAGGVRDLAGVEHRAPVGGDQRAVVLVADGAGLDEGRREARRPRPDDPLGTEVDGAREVQQAVHLRSPLHGAGAEGVVHLLGVVDAAAACVVLVRGLGDHVPDAFPVVPALVQREGDGAVPAVQCDRAVEEHLCAVRLGRKGQQGQRQRGTADCGDGTSQ